MLKSSTHAFRQVVKLVLVAATFPSSQARFSSKMVSGSSSSDKGEFQSPGPTLESFGYAFNSEGELRKIDPESGRTGDLKFEFNVTNNHKNNQKHYEALGEVIEEHIYKLMEDEGLKRFPVPFDADVDEPQTFVFATPNFLENSSDKNLLILVHGSGVVRAGQWARRLIINESLKTGTQLPYIKRGKELGYSILVLNTNDNKKSTESGDYKIRGSENPIEHALHVWDKYVMKANPAKIAIVAHSFGGICTTALAKERQSQFEEKVFAVAFTDSAHFFLSGDNVKHLRKVGRNWCASDELLDSLLYEEDDENMAVVSAGHTEHEWTSASAFESVFKYIEEMRVHGNAKLPPYAAQKPETLQSEGTSSAVEDQQELVESNPMEDKEEDKKEEKEEDKEEDKKEDKEEEKEEGGNKMALVDIPLTEDQDQEIKKRKKHSEEKEIACVSKEDYKEKDEL